MSTRILSASILAMILAACGSSSETLEQSSTAAAALQTASHETVLLDASAVATNGGINPTFRAYELTGSVLLGGNQCEANGVSAELVQVVKNRVLTVVAKLHTPRDILARICPRIYQPIYASLNARVEIDSTKVRRVQVKNVNDEGNTVRIEALAPAEREAVMTAVTANPTNGGFNPDAFAYTVSAQVELGSNRCMADGVGAKIETRKIGSTLYVFAVKNGGTRTRFCTMEYAPVFATVTETIRGFSSTTPRIMVKNVDAFGALIAINLLPNN